MSNSSMSVSINLKKYFMEQVSIAMTQRRVKTFPMVETYIVDLLESFAFSGSIQQTTLAEMYLTAMSEPSMLVKFDLLKKLGDTSLYVSGFFGDSLKRKVVDIDYYADLGGKAYEHLSKSVEEDTVSRVYKEISQRFLSFVDVLTIVSQRALIQTNEDLLRLYDRYITTGSELARDELIERGMPLPRDQKKKSQ